MTLVKLGFTAVLFSAVLHRALSAPSPQTGSPSTLPVVDLGYARYTPSYNATADVYLFSGIRFAAPPTGERRFAKPAPPLQEDSNVVNNGSDWKGCQPVVPGWVAPPQFTTGYVGDEDCLFLDVWVPRKVFEGQAGKVPVFFWLFSGAFVVGSSKTEGPPLGLLSAADKPIIYVATNYRLGAFGWLAGPTFRAGSNTVENAGFYDQLAALEWVQKYIKKFQGNSSQVTVAGQSAGGSSILHHITARGGRGSPPPFRRAIAQSPGYRMIAPASSETVYKAFEDAAGCAGQGVACLRAQPQEVLRKANAKGIHEAVLPNFGPGVGYGPVIDGSYVPAYPGHLIAQGRYHLGINVIASHNADEGLSYTKPTITDETFTAEIQSIFPYMPASSLNKLVTELYPPANENTTYTTPFGRASLVTKEASFACNALFLSKTLAATYRYTFTVPPARHGQDLAYTFYNGPNVAVTVPAIASLMQEYLTDFTTAGQPNSANSGQSLPLYLGGRVLELGQQVRVVSDELANKRCEFWQTAKMF